MEVMEVDANFEESTTTLLNVDTNCLLKIYGMLKFRDRMSLAETCKQFEFVSQLIFSKSKIFVFKKNNKKRTHNVIKYIDRVFYHIGPYLETLFLSEEYALTKIDKNVVNLKNLVLAYVNLVHDYSTCEALNHIEFLMLFGCDFKKNKSFFKMISNLKYLIVKDCRGLKRRSLQKFFTKNVKIVSVILDNPSDFQIKMLPLLVNIETLSLTRGIDEEMPLDISMLPQLKQLKSLQIKGPRFYPVFDTLIEFAKNGTLERLVIDVHHFDEETFGILSSFERLQFLDLGMEKTTPWNSLLALPPNLKQLTLRQFQISTTDIATLMRGLTSVENIQFSCCIIMDNNGRKIRNFIQKCEHIVSAINNDDNQLLISVYIPHCPCPCKFGLCPLPNCGFLEIDAQV